MARRVEQSKVNPFNYKYFSDHPLGAVEDRIIQDKIKFNSKEKN